MPLYLAEARPVVPHEGTLLIVDDERFMLRAGEQPALQWVCFRTLGCPRTGAGRSRATTVAEVVQEMLHATTSERQGRMTYYDAHAPVEKKQEDYF